LLIAGVDEVGRGAIFGMVVAGAVVLDPDREAYLRNLGVTDSKKLSPQRRQQLAQVIRSTALDCQIGIAEVAEIDQLNILQASLLAMERAIAQLQIKPDHCLVDGIHPIPFRTISPIPQTTVVRGDSLHTCIASASIVAKVWRDEQMIQMAQLYPQYDLARNKGYCTPAHRRAIEQYGYCDQHRVTYSRLRLLAAEPVGAVRSGLLASTGSLCKNPLRADTGCPTA
jgi:ribonuclease HII